KTRDGLIRVRNIRALNGRFNTSITHAYSIVIGSKHITLNATGGGLTIFVILVVWFLLPRVARLMIHTPTAISIFVCLSMVQLMAVFISMRCTLCGHFLQVALTLILVVGYAIAAS